MSDESQREQHENNQRQERNDQQQANNSRVTLDVVIWRCLIGAMAVIVAFGGYQQNRLETRMTKSEDRLTADEVALAKIPDNTKWMDRVEGELAEMRKDFNTRFDRLENNQRRLLNQAIEPEIKSAQHPIVQADGKTL